MFGQEHFIHADLKLKLNANIKHARGRVEALIQEFFQPLVSSSSSVLFSSKSEVNEAEKRRGKEREGEGSRKRSERLFAGKAKSRISSLMDFSV